MFFKNQDLCNMKRLKENIFVLVYKTKRSCTKVVSWDKESVISFDTDYMYYLLPIYIFSTVSKTLACYDINTTWLDYHACFLDLMCFWLLIN